ncbi:MAG TPA: OmpH family outer membrane protein [Syntrophales bacterium]|nr:OmpH family outer membrane protein [Syntrophobacterales bacterium]HRR39699.1 OmpH family outer membrane protein [Syntrophales bacterium]HRT27100.1 OmpH family outer membrane protein [Syntrophales bacterium]HRT71304.1 OmpH family outer membrane protein [Syntrophales bacterium]
MKKFILIPCLIVFSVLLLSSVSASAAEKIGFINMREIIDRSDAGKAIKAELEKAVEGKKAAIQQKEKELKKAKENLDKQRSVLTPQAMQEKEMQYQVEYREYERLVKDSAEELRAKDQFMANKLFPEIIKVVKAIGQREKYAAILDESAALYSSKENSLTDKVIKELNKTYQGK